MRKRHSVRLVLVADHPTAVYSGMVPRAAFWPSLLTWCMGDLLGIITLAPTLLLASAPARAQIGACEDLKARLAQRISGGPGSYVMEAVPAATAVPPGVKVIGTCGGGAWKVLFRRGSAPIVLDGATSAPTASRPPPFRS